MKPRFVPVPGKVSRQSNDDHKAVKTMNQELEAELEEILRSSMMRQAFGGDSSLNEEEQQRLSELKNEHGFSQVQILLAKLATNMEHPHAQGFWKIMG